MHEESSAIPRVDDLLRILEISRHQAETFDLQSLLAEIEAAACEILKCERATVFVFDHERNELYSCVESRQEFVHIPADQGIAGASFQSGELLNIADAYREPRFNSAIDRETGFKTRNLLACPLRLSNRQILGVIEVLNKEQGAFTRDDALLLETFAAQSAVSIQRQFLMQEFAERKRLQAELAIAKRIQQGLLPEAAQQLAGFDIFGWNQPADETGGDFYDFRRLHDDKLLFMIADIAGHGLGPALLAAQCAAFERAVFSMSENLEAGITRINELLCEHIPDDRFATAFLGLIQAGQDHIQAISAGHEPVFVYRAETQMVENIPVTALALGIFHSSVYDEWQRIRLAPGDALVALTDGFVEAEDRHGEALGSQRIIESIRAAGGRDAEAILAALREAFMRHIHGTRQTDDLTAIIIKRNAH